MGTLFLWLIVGILIYGFYLGAKEDIDKQYDDMKKTFDEKLKELED